MTDCFSGQGFHILSYGSKQPKSWTKQWKRYCIVHSIIDSNYWFKAISLQSSSTYDTGVGEVTKKQPTISHSFIRVWWLSGKFSALHSEGRRFESHSSHHVVGTLVKSFTCSCLWRFDVLTQTQYQWSSREHLWVVVDLKRCYRWSPSIVFETQSICVLWSFNRINQCVSSHV